MTEYQVAEDGAAAPVAARAPRTIVIERSGASGGVIALIVAMMALIAAVGFFLFAADTRNQQNADAIQGAAQQVSETARSVGQSVTEAADRVAPRQ